LKNKKSSIKPYFPPFDIVRIVQSSIFETTRALLEKVSSQQNQ